MKPVQKRELRSRRPMHIQIHLHIPSPLASRPSPLVFRSSPLVSRPSPLVFRSSPLASASHLTLSLIQLQFSSAILHRTHRDIERASARTSAATPL